MTTTPESGATVAATKKRTIWPWLLLAALIAALAIWWLVAALTDDDDTVTDAATSTPTVAVTTDATDASGAAETGSTTAAGATTATATPTTTSPDVALGTVLIAGNLDALATGADLAASLGESVEANSVQVQAVVADEAFYVGPEPGRTVLVRLENFAGNGPESPVDINVGDTVSFTGTVKQIDQEFLSNLKLYDSAEQLATGDFYLQSENLTVTK